jgi:hypothetical protein
MNINSVDELIDSSLDNFYKHTVLNKNSYFKDVTKNPNFVKYQLKKMILKKLLIVLIILNEYLKL